MPTSTLKEKKMEGPAEKKAEEVQENGYAVDVIDDAVPPPACSTVTPAASTTPFTNAELSRTTPDGPNQTAERLALVEQAASIMTPSAVSKIGSPSKVTTEKKDKGTKRKAMITDSKAKVEKKVKKDTHSGVNIMSFFGVKKAEVSAPTVVEGDTENKTN